ncbi:MAG: hemerythrin [Firmicutes bacterium HGW-Firmicutes-1]|jgi:hemerythrin-like domain-containing protein|nr:MAG: hemerythrin [Firmicutes bacterium HGW-Firmicutes-1]
MDTIQLMIDEHKYIKRMLQVVRKASLNILQGGGIDFNDFYQMIDFVRNYADNHHHGKEEKLLFNRMVEELGPLGEKLIRHGMLVEHDLGRLYMKDLEAALLKVRDGDEEAKIDVIANAVSYTNLLNRHIDKEDTVIYTFAQRSLSPESMNEINIACDKFEAEMEVQKVQEKYIHLVETLEAKYKV